MMAFEVLRTKASCTLGNLFIGITEGGQAPDSCFYSPWVSRSEAKGVASAVTGFPQKNSLPLAQGSRMRSGMLCGNSDQSSRI